MIFSRKTSTEQIREAMQEVLADKGQKLLDSALQQNQKLLDDALQQDREFAGQQAARDGQISELLGKNQKTLRSLSDTVEDFLDTLQEQDEKQRQAGQKQAAAEEREQRLVTLLALYQEQMELVEQWITEQDREPNRNRESLEAWKQQYAMLKGKINTESRFCTVEYTGAAGEPVDYRLHEVLQAIEPGTPEQEGTVEKVCSQGMLYQGNVIRKARVIAYRKA